ncbi:MAG TPA: hypothetical protein VFY48_05725 [Solirubrobacterales bacterium]|nr:hypothetical protein [Solirubrobacterales bacterium]
MDERKELLRFVHIALAVTAPVLLVGAMLLKNADEAVQQGFAMLGFLLYFSIFFFLDERNKRRKRRDQ